MKKLILLSMLLMIKACSSIHDIPAKDRSRGDYLFNQKLKGEYTKYFLSSVFKNGSYVYAGPSFLEFNNFQMIKIDQLGRPDQGITIFTEEDGTRHEYSSHTPFPPFYGARSQEGVLSFLLEFTGSFKSFQQVVPGKLNLIGRAKCKKDIKCHLIPDIDFALFSDPYDFTFELEEADKVINENVELSNFTDFEATAIANRMIYRGMSQKAAELAIGKSPSSQAIHSYRNVIFENGTVSNFEFGNYNYDLHYFIRR